MTRKAIAGKFAGRSLFKVERTSAPKFDDPAKLNEWPARLKAYFGGTAAEQLAGLLDPIERDAHAVLKRHGYRGAAIITGALALPMNDPAGRAARILVEIESVRACTTAPATRKAALAMHRLMGLTLEAAVDQFAEPVRRDESRQRGAGAGGRTKRHSAVPAWKEAAATALRATAPKHSAKDAWAWLKSNGQLQVIGGTVEIEGDGRLHFDGSKSDAAITFDAMRKHFTAARAEIDAAAK